MLKLYSVCYLCPSLENLIRDHPDDIDVDC